MKLCMTLIYICYILYIKYIQYIIIYIYYILTMHVAQIVNTEQLQNYIPFAARI